MPNMKKTAKMIILEAFRQMLASIIRLALRNGVNFSEFCELAKSLYVQIAGEDYGLGGRVTNNSRIALITGINRREIKKVREQKNNTDHFKVDGSSSISRIITAWHDDPFYTDSNGGPLALMLEGKSPNFTELVQQYGGDIAPITVMREFKRSGVIREMPSGEIHIVKRYYIPNYFESADKEPEFINPDAIRFGGSMLVDHINTIFYNLYNDDEGSVKRMELRAINPRISKDRVPEFYKYADELSMEYLTKIDQWLTKNEGKEAQVVERVGVGLYFIEGKNQSIGI